MQVCDLNYSGVYSSTFSVFDGFVIVGDDVLCVVSGGLVQVLRRTSRKRLSSRTRLSQGAAR